LLVRLAWVFFVIGGAIREFPGVACPPGRFNRPAVFRRVDTPAAFLV